jgi:hypothetical protein
LGALWASSHAAGDGLDINNSPRQIFEWITYRQALRRNTLIEL